MKKTKTKLKGKVPKKKKGGDDPEASDQDPNEDPEDDEDDDDGEDDGEDSPGMSGSDGGEE